MFWVERDGVRLPRRLAGDVALDACNTLAGWNEPPAVRRDWLTGYDVLVRWAGYAGLVGEDDSERLRRTAARRRADADAALARFRLLRRAVHDATLARDARALRTVSAFAREAATHGRLEATGDGIAWRLGRSASLDRPTLALARAAEQLLLGPDVRHVRSCPGPVCGWVFVSRDGRRKWCSMADCGNRAKVAAFAARNR